MKGYKVFNSDWTCKGYQYEVGKVYEMKEKPIICGRGFHFCLDLIDCFSYYLHDSSNKVAEIEALGDIDNGNENSKHCTNKIKIVREIPWDEVQKLVNAGKENSGLGNSGDRNTGDYNTGNRNAGDRNTGCRNTGDYNTGCWNTGDWNSANYSSGVFNTKMQKILMFDKPSDWDIYDWFGCEARYVLSCMPCDTIIIKNDKPIEKKAKKAERQRWWDKLSDEDKECVKSLPNFDAGIFNEITGIEV